MGTYLVWGVSNTDEPRRTPKLEGCFFLNDSALSGVLLNIALNAFRHATLGCLLDVYSFYACCMVRFKVEEQKGSGAFLCFILAQIMKLPRGPPAHFKTTFTRFEGEGALG